MLPKNHILLGFVFSFFLFLFFPSIGYLEFTIIFLASFLIDVDIYLSYVLNEKDFGLKNAIRVLTERRRKFFSLSRKNRKSIPNKKRNIRIFHGVEVLIILFLANIFISEFFLYVFVGFAIHLFLDLLEQVYCGLGFTKVSLIYSLYLKYISKE